MTQTLIFDKHDRRYWIKSVNSICKRINPNISGLKSVYRISLCGDVSKQNFKPIHIVLLSCMIELMDRNKHDIILNCSDNELYDYLNNDLHLDRYFNQTKANYVEAESKFNLNIFKVQRHLAEGYSITVSDFLKRNYFTGYDISAFKNSLDEIYANISDHSQSDGIAFSFISYEEDKGILHVAACDLGRGIPTSLRSAGYNFSDDKQAIQESTMIGISAKSTTHNKGMGLDNIISSLSSGGTIRIISNKALLFCIENRRNMRLFDLEFDFKGTLIYFDIPVSNFEEEEMFNDTELDW